MNRCFELAERGRGATRSNPLVGALLVHNDKIVAEGFHAFYGGPHAELNCINRLTNRELLGESTLYVSLEPCNFLGKTPACTDYILNHGLKKVVIGSADFNPRVRNQGIDYLRSQEIEVLNLDWQERQKSLNIRFFINQTQNEPYFIGKLSMSRDGYIGRKGERVKITAPEIDVISHKIRSEVDAILVGKITWEIDKPSLHARLYHADIQSDIIVLDHNLKSSISTEDGRQIHFVSRDDPKALKKSLFDLGYKNILVEGGGEVFQFFSSHKLFHEVLWIENQDLVLGSGIEAPKLNHADYSLKEQKHYFNHILSYHQRHDLSTI
jgi:diaminohydroxyphosphoribosylaminopyrimidine deaminase/5-amino-6-(5-phosphoribosylamino)uracil reductase